MKYVRLNNYKKGIEIVSISFFIVNSTIKGAFSQKSKVNILEP